MPLDITNPELTRLSPTQHVRGFPLSSSFQYIVARNERLQKNYPEIECLRVSLPFTRPVSLAAFGLKSARTLADDTC